jgi:hypothetical protein
MVVVRVVAVGCQGHCVLGAIVIVVVCDGGGYGQGGGYRSSLL